jgi:hypothetical protein
LAQPLHVIWAEAGVGVSHTKPNAIAQIKPLNISCLSRAPDGNVLSAELRVRDPFAETGAGGRRLLLFPLVQIGRELFPEFSKP